MVGDEIVGAVLAGGTSSRMGADKAKAILAGSSLRDRALSVLRLVFREVALSVSAPEPELAGCPVVVDRQTDSGPLAALEATLTAADGRAVFVLACDLPLVDEPVVRRIVSRAEGLERAEGARAWVARADGHIQPLCGLYSAPCRDIARARLDSGRLSMRGLLGALEVTEVELDDLGSDRLLNVNRPADLERARRAVDV